MKTRQPPAFRVLSGSARAAVCLALGSPFLAMGSATLAIRSAWAQSAPVPSRADEAAALSIVARAKADGGELALAADMYLQAHRMNAAVAGYLYSAARCFHKASAWEAADREYRRFLETAPAVDAARAKAVEYLAEVAPRLAEARAAEAQAASASQIEESRRQAEARKTEADGKVAEALRTAEARKASEAAALRKSEAAAESAAEAERRQAAAAETARQQAAAMSSGHRTVAWLAVAGGVAAAGGGVALWLGANADFDALQSKLNAKDGAGKITGIPREDATTMQDEANLRRGLGMGLVAMGAVGLGVGSWLLASAAPSVAIEARQVWVAWQF
ncbi:MAG: hypothetical protein EXR79_02560 [Myxococcales bacterium]|nr:hypothetical protein [Myxococcales bacterium]